MKKYWLCFRDFWQETLHRQFRLTALLFCAVTAAGFVICQRNSQLISRLMELLESALSSVSVEEAADTTQAISPLSEVPLYFFNNASSLFSTLLWSLVPFLNLSALSLCANALVLGGFTSYALQTGSSWKAVLLGTLPHGIFEFAAIALTCAAGIYLCGAVTDSIRRKEDAEPLSKAFQNCLAAFWCGVLPLLLISAVVESFITPLLLK